MAASANLGSRVLSAIAEEPGIMKPQLAVLLGVSKSSIDRVVAELKAAGSLECVGSNKTGYWHVIE